MYGSSKYADTTYGESTQRLQTTTVSISKAVDYRLIIFSKEDLSSLPTNDSPLANLYTSQEVLDVQDDDAARVPMEAAEDNYSVHQFQKEYTNNNEHIYVTWNGQTDIKPTDSTIYLQVYNNASGSWEDIDSNNTANSNTDFNLSGSTSGTASDYYDNENKVSIRVYQREPV